MKNSFGHGEMTHFVYTNKEVPVVVEGGRISCQESYATLKQLTFLSFVLSRTQQMVCLETYEATQTLNCINSARKHLFFQHVHVPNKQNCLRLGVR